MNKRVAVKIRPWSRLTSFPWVIRDTLALACRQGCSIANLADSTDKLQRTVVISAVWGLSAGIARVEA